MIEVKTGIIQIANNRIYKNMSGKGNPGVAVAEFETGKEEKGAARSLFSI